MGFYGDRVLPRILDLVGDAPAVRPLRGRVCAGLHGRVVEIGFGSGLNVPHYPAAVTSVAAVEPSDVAWQLAARHVAASPVPVERVGLDGQALPLPDASCDTALSTLTLCTIPDPLAALGEVCRVLVPGGTFHFLEHGIAPDPGVQRWQRRLEPLQKRLVGGCHLTRDVPELLRAAGFEVVELDRFYLRGAPRPIGAQWLGVARVGGTD